MNHNDVTVAYLYVTGGDRSDGYARHFLDTYKANPAGADHRGVILCNRGIPTGRSMTLLREFGWDMLGYGNEGWDIGAYQSLSRGTAGLQVCLGESVYFVRPGWLRRLVDAWQQYGHGIYGPLASYTVRPHIVTTAFAVSPQHLQNYPAVRNKQERYDFEHGARALWMRVLQWGGCAKLVTWDGEYDWQNWRAPANIYCRGDQSACLVRCNHTDRYFGANATQKAKWQESADRLWRLYASRKGKVLPN